MLRNLGFCNFAVKINRSEKQLKRLFNTLFDCLMQEISKYTLLYIYRIK